MTINPTTAGYVAPKKSHQYVDNSKFYYALVEYRKKCDIARAKHAQAVTEWKKACRPILKTLRATNKALYAKFLEDKALREGSRLRKEKGIWPRNISLAYGLPHEPVLQYPKISDYIGGCILLIAKGLSNYYAFSGYSYRDEMAADGIEDAVLRVNSFDSERAQFTIKDKAELSKKFISSDFSKIHKYAKQTYRTDLSEKDIKSKIKNIFTMDLDYPKFKLEVRRNPFAYFTQICYYAAVRRIKKEKKQTSIKSEMVKNSGIIDSLSNNVQGGDDAEYQNAYLKFLLENVDNNTMTEEEKKEAQKNKRTTKAHQKKIKEQELLEGFALDGDGIDAFGVDRSDEPKIQNELEEVIDFLLDEDEGND
jgi:hypothetical protein